MRDLISKKERKKAEKLFFDGLSLLNQSKLEKALTIFNKAIKINPYDKRIYSIKMELLLKMGRYKETADSAKEGMKYML